MFCCCLWGRVEPIPLPDGTENAAFAEVVPRAMGFRNWIHWTTSDYEYDRMAPKAIPAAPVLMMDLTRLQLCNALEGTAEKVDKLQADLDVSDRSLRFAKSKLLEIQKDLDSEKANSRRLDRIADDQCRSIRDLHFKIKVLKLDHENTKGVLGRTNDQLAASHDCDRKFRAMLQGRIETLEAQNASLSAEIDMLRVLGGYD